MKLVINYDNGGLSVTLSKRNLLALLTKLEMSPSAQTIFTENCFMDVGSEQLVPLTGVTLYVRSECDEEHYKDRAYPPGEMHPTTERMINEADVAER